MSFFAELKRRNVVRVGGAYAVIGWVLAQIAEFGFENFGAPDWVLKTFIVVLLLGLPLALFFAWAFEITPEGVKREKDVDRSQSITHVTGRKLDFIIIGALVIALSYFMWERQGLIGRVDSSTQPIVADAEEAETGAPNKRSIAVLPFVNMSSDQEQEWFADGLTEELLNALARAPDLLVAARTSSFKFKGSAEDIPTIAKALGVAHVLEGSVRRGRGRLRVTAQLVRASDGFHLWSENYDRDPDDVIAIQEEVAIEIARALETAIDPEALALMVSAGTTSVPAYEAHLESLAYFARALESGDERLYLKEKAALERAQSLDSQFAAAHWRMAQFWQRQMEVTRIGSELTSDTAEERKTKYKIVIAKAIAAEKDPVRRTRYRAAESLVDLRFREGLSLITDYLSSRPNDYVALETQLGALMNLGRWEDARPVARRLADIAGDDSESIQEVIANLVFANDAAGAAEIARRALEHHHANNALVQYQAHRAFLWDGAIDEARKLLPAIKASQLPRFNQNVAAMRQACAEGDTVAALSIHEELVKEHQEDQAGLWLSYHMLGQDKQATAVLMTYDESNQLFMLSNYLMYPYFDPRPYSNLMDLLERQGVNRQPSIDIPFRCSVPAE